MLPACMKSKAASVLAQIGEVEGKKVVKESGTKDIYVCWYDEDKAEAFAALWLANGTEDDEDKADAFVAKEYGEKGMVNTFEPGVDIKDAKKDCGRLVIQLAKKAGVDVKWRGKGEGEIDVPESKTTESKKDDEKTIELLVAKFGEEFRDEIADGFDAADGYDAPGSFTADGTNYNFYDDDSDAEQAAIQSVTDMLETDPESFSQDFLQQHISISDTDKRIMAGEEADAQVENMDDEDILDKAGVKDEYEEAEAEDDSKKMDKILSDAKETVQEEIAKDLEKQYDDPIAYFVEEQGIFSIEDLMKASFISIDIKSAAQEAVSVDGWAHFLSSYDGNYEELDNGVVYFRES